MRILYVEDDEIIASGLVYALSREGFDVAHCGSVLEASAALEGGGFDLALLDLSLPDGSGFDICRRIREDGDTPVIFLTAADDEGNTVRGLESGADDYISKPLRVRELIARIHAVTRRRAAAADMPAAPSAGANADASAGSGAETGAFAGAGRGAGAGAAGLVLTLGDVEIHPASAKVFRGGEEIILSALEYRLLLIFASNKGQVLTREVILEQIWDEAGNFVNDNTLTVYIKRLRERLGDGPKEPSLICTVRGIGYRAVGDT